jgi:hypothetical protein
MAIRETRINHALFGSVDGEGESGYFIESNDWPTEGEESSLSVSEVYGVLRSLAAPTNGGGSQ